MKHFIIITDTNSRQYVFEIKNDSITINCCVYGKEDISQEFMRDLLAKSQLSIENAAFNTSHLVAIQAQSYEEGTM